MPIATRDEYRAMLDRAKHGHFAYPAINVTSSQTLHAALRGFADAESDGIVQVSTGGAAFLSGATVGDMVAGATGLAEYAAVVADSYPVRVALHTDHCPEDKLESFVQPLLHSARERIHAGREPSFQSHMWDGSALPLERNLAIARELLDETDELGIVLEVEIGVVGGAEDGVDNAINEKLYTTVEDARRTAEVLGVGDRGRYLLAATFGNVHGVYAPGNVKLEPAILHDIQVAVGDGRATAEPFDLVFHGGSGSDIDEIHQAIDYGVVKMNIDTDTQYSYTRAIADHILLNYDGVLKVDGRVGRRDSYDPRSYGKTAEASMAERVTRACVDLRSAGTKMA